MLGCTHFPVFRGALQRLLPNTRIVDSAATTANAVRERLGMAAAEGVSPGDTGASVQFLATDGLARFARVGRSFLGAPPQAVELVDL